MNNIRHHFPFLAENPELHYFDSAATTQKPQQVINAIHTAYHTLNAPVHRGIYRRAEEMTARYEAARAKTASFINADPSEIIFTRSATSGINMVAASWAEQRFQQGDEIIISALEHHSNILPWQRVCQRTGAFLKIIPLREDYTLDYAAFEALIGPRTRLVAFLSTSHVLGTQTDCERIIKIAQSNNVPVLVDAAQSIGHHAIDVQKLESDFLVFSGHKVLGPTGIGALYVNRRRHAEIEPYELGGSMVRDLDTTSATWLDMPWKCEAGTPPFIQAVGLAAALDFITEHIPYTALHQHYEQLALRTIAGLKEIEGITIHGPTNTLSLKSRHIISFTIDGYHPHDIAAYFDTHGIAVRAGHHCALPLVRTLNRPTGTVRLSFHAYNTLEEVEWFITNLKQLPHSLRVHNQFALSKPDCVR